MSTSKPGLGVAQRTSTVLEVNEMAVAPPISWNVMVSAGADATVVVVVLVVVVLGVEVDVDVVELLDVLGGAVELVGPGVVVGVVVVLDDEVGIVVLDDVVVVSVTVSEVVTPTDAAAGTAGGGSMISSLTTSTPALATAMAATVPMSQRAMRATGFMGPPCRGLRQARANTRLNDP